MIKEKDLTTKLNGTWVSMYIDHEANNLLSIAAKKSRRTKRSECEVRLKDHLLRFSLISTEGVATAQHDLETKGDD